MNNRSTDSLRQLLDRARKRDPLGDRVHFLLACLYLIAVPIGPAPEAIALSILGGYSILRLWAIFRTWGRLFLRSPLIWLLALSALWLCVSMIWSRDRNQAVDEITDLRVQIPVILCFWPILAPARIRTLIFALFFGVIMMTAVQIGQHFGIAWCINVGFHGIVPGRSPGLLHPALTAVLAMTTGAFAIVEFSFAIKYKRRITAVFIFLVSTTSILLTGSRGPMIAACTAWLIVGFITWRSIRNTVVNQPHHTRNGKVIAGVFIIILIGGWWLVGPTLRGRVVLLINETKSALVDREYHTDVGIRIKQAQIALRAFTDHPVLGIGAGSYRIYAETEYASSNSGDESSSGADIPIMNHPHSALLYALSTTGIPGILLYLAFWYLLIRQSLRTALDNPNRDSFLLALPGLAIGLFIAFAVDSQNLSAPGMVVLSFITAIIAYYQMIRRDQLQSDDTTGAPTPANSVVNPAITTDHPVIDIQQSPVKIVIPDGSSLNRRLVWLLGISIIAILTTLLFTDISILRWYFSLDLPAWTWSQEAFWSKHGHLIIIIAGLLFLWKKDKAWLIDGLIALAFSFIAVSILKHTIGRVRPSNAGDPFLFFSFNTIHDSYPSGHTAAVWVIIFAMLRAYGRFGWLWVLFGIIIIWARMHALAHYFTDAAAAVVIAFGCESAARNLLRTIINHATNSPRKINPVKIMRPIMVCSIIITIPVLLTIPVHTDIPPRHTAAEYNQLITKMYQRIMHRPADDGSRALWMNKLPRVQLISDPVFQFAVSGEFYRSIRDTNSESEARVVDIYHRLLDRPPDEIELNKAATLLDQGQDAQSLKYAIRLLATRIILSREYLKRFGPFSMPGDPTHN